MKQIKGKPIRITELIHGPFVIYATDDSDLEVTQVVSPDGGFKSAGDALAYIEASFANRKVPYLGMRFDIVQMVSPHSFNQFCSWED